MNETSDVHGPVVGVIKLLLPKELRIGRGSEWNKKVEDCMNEAMLKLMLDLDLPHGKGSFLLNFNPNTEDITIECRVHKSIQDGAILEKAIAESEG